MPGCPINMTRCPIWCHYDRSDDAPMLGESALHATEAVEVGDVQVSIWSVDDEAPEVFVTGEPDVSSEGARQLAIAILADADRLAELCLLSSACEFLQRKRRA